MPDLKPTGFWPRARKIFRRVRLAIWIALLAALLAGVGFSVFGLPGCVTRPLAEKLRARGVELHFARLRLSWWRGLVAYDVKFGGERAADAPQFFARRVEVPVRITALRNFDFEIGGLRVFDGRLACPVGRTNEPPRDFVLDQIEAVLRFKTDDDWELDRFQARLGGVKFYFNGALTHATALRQKKSAPTGGPQNVPATPDKWRAQLRQFADALGQARFVQPAGLRVTAYADARDLRGCRFSASASAADTVTPWGELRGTRLMLRSSGFSNATNAAGVTFARVQTSLDGGGLDAQAAFDLATREMKFNLVSDFDVQKIRPLLTYKAQRWLAQYSWKSPPHLQGYGALTVPDWSQPGAFRSWHEEVMPTLHLEGELKTGHAAFRGVPVLAAEARVNYSNRIWRLPELRVTRPEGVTVAEHWTDERTQDYYWRVSGAFDPRCIRPLLEGTNEQHALDLVGFATPPQIDGEIWGRWEERERTGVKATVAVSNFTFRGEQISELRTMAAYTNLFLQMFYPEVVRREGRATLDGAAFDFAAKMAYLTNCNATLDLSAVTRCIGPKTARVMEAYQFLAPPRARVEGSVSLENSKRANLAFHLDGGPFRWLKFNVPQISGDIFWRDESLSLTNIAAEFYSGRLAGWAAFDFSPAEGNGLQFDMTAADARLGALMHDLTGSSNKLEGLVSGQVAVRRGNTSDYNTWQGGGSMKLKDGALWEIPVFGVFAPVLDTLWPNLGSGRAYAGSATYAITNGAVRTTDLELRSQAMRMQYRGAVDFDGKLDARVEGEIMRDTWLVGPVVSAALMPVSKVLEYKISGTLGEPKIEPLFLPKALLIPFHPIQSVKELFAKPATNAPAAAPK